MQFLFRTEDSRSIARTFSWVYRHQLQFGVSESSGPSPRTEEQLAMEEMRKKEVRHVRSYGIRLKRSTKVSNGLESTDTAATNNEGETANSSNDDDHSREIVSWKEFLDEHQATKQPSASEKCTEKLDKDKEEENQNLKVESPPKKSLSAKLSSIFKRSVSVPNQNQNRLNHALGYSMHPSNERESQVLSLDKPSKPKRNRSIGGVPIRKLQTTHTSHNKSVGSRSGPRHDSKNGSSLDPECDPSRASNGGPSLNLSVQHNLPWDFLYKGINEKNTYDVPKILRDSVEDLTPLATSRETPILGASTENNCLLTLADEPAAEEPSRRFRRYSSRNPGTSQSVAEVAEELKSFSNLRSG